MSRTRATSFEASEAGAEWSDPEDGLGLGFTP
jgi:hypothetical protein